MELVELLELPRECHGVDGHSQGHGSNRPQQSRAPRFETRMWVDVCHLAAQLCRLALRRRARVVHFYAIRVRGQAVGWRAMVR